MEQLLTTLSRAVEGAPVIALGASFVWGILSIILSPCHLASIPLIVGFISGQGQVTPRRAFWTATLFAVGILITIAAIGVVTAAAGRMLGDVGRYGNYFVALIFFASGTAFGGGDPVVVLRCGARRHAAKGIPGCVHSRAGVRHCPRAHAPSLTWPRCWP